MLSRLAGHIVPFRAELSWAGPLHEKIARRETFAPFLPRDEINQTKLAAKNIVV